MKNEYCVKGDITEIYVTRKNNQTLTVIIDTEDLPLLCAYNSAYITVGCPLDIHIAEVPSKARVLLREQKVKVVRPLTAVVTTRIHMKHINGNRLDCRKENLRASRPSDSKYTEFIGTKVGALTILGFTDQRSKTGSPELMCACDCGTMVTRTAASLWHNKKTVESSCGCKKRGYNSTSFTGYGKISGSYIARMHQNAVTRGLECSVTAEYLDNLFKAQNEKCALSGVSIYFQEGTNAFLNSNTTASVDRIDSTLGYIEGNVQWVHKVINAMKLHFDEAHFINMCTKVAKWRGTDGSY